MENELVQASSPPRALNGFVLIDSALQITHYNSVAVQIIGYPDVAPPYKILNNFISGTFSSAARPSASGKFSFVFEFLSGRRQYICRGHLLGQTQSGLRGGCIAVVLQRRSSIWSGLTQVFTQFGLTPRESQVLRLILWGFASKEIASEMKVSPNTVQAFHQDGDDQNGGFNASTSYR